jgi:hypothetical protein
MSTIYISGQQNLLQVSKNGGGGGKRAFMTAHFQQQNKFEGLENTDKGL